MKKKKNYIGDYGFLIWFNSDKKEEYYLTPFYEFGNLTEDELYKWMREVKKWNLLRN